MVGHTETVAEANHVVFFNMDEPYRVSHPIAGGDANLSIRVAEPLCLSWRPQGISTMTIALHSSELASH
jgi:hypothetical protein